jgi:hypothetical protein
MSQVYNYHTCKGVFSDAKWPISELKESLKELVCIFLLMCMQIFNAFNQDGSNDPICVWKILDRQNPLVSLAILILSFVPNSASTERLFSSMGDIKTKKRNRLGVQKLRDCALVKGEIRRLHAAEGTARIRLKHKFGNSSPTVADTNKSGSRVEDEDIVQAAERDAADGLGGSEDENDTDTDSEDEGEGGSRSFAAITRQFEKDAEADSGSDSDDEDTNLGEGSLLNNQPSTTTRRVGTSQCSHYYIDNLT